MISHPVVRRRPGMGPFASALLFAAALLSALPVAAAALPNRLRADAQTTQRAELPQGVSAHVAHAQALGHLSGETQLSTMSLALAPSAAQSAALDQLLVDQQDPSSASYHQWLTPEQFGARFGVSDDDLQVLENWLTSQGLQVVSVAPSRNAIQFSGNAATVESAFRTNMGRFHKGDQDFYENSTAPTIPAAFQGVVAAVNGLSSYRLRGEAARKQMRPSVYEGLSPNLTGTDSSGNVVHALTPYDVRQIYGAAPLYSSGYNGTGLKIGVIGQSAVNTTQLGYFQTLTGQTVKAPTLVLVPNSGNSTIYSGDEGESEADLEFAGGVAPGASLYFVYTGNASNTGVFTALQYAITTNAAQVLTLSYGGCEPANASGTAGIETYLRQANAQGQTVLVSSGDSGAAACDSAGDTAAQDGLQVSYPASSAYVTAIGGTTFNEGTASSTYWSSSNNSQRGSALGYIPEVAWNDSAAAKGVLSTGGGASRLFSKPNWQTGTGVPADGARDVPDISFSASNYHDAYILCTADTGYSGTNSRGVTVTGACTSTALGAYQVGGTSLSAPSFAGMLAIVLNANASSGLGNINPALYTLRNTTPAIFHDITSGNNIVPCVVSTQDCTTGSLGYSTTAGYDLVTGLGSLDIGQFSAAIKTAVTASTRVPTVNLAQTATTTSSITYRITVASSASSTVATGTVSVALDGGTATVLTLSSGAASYVVSTTGLTVGTHTLTASYSGDTNYSSASSSASFSTTQVGGSLTATASSVTVASGATGTITLNVTSSGYTGLVAFNTIAAATGSTLPSPGCFLGRNDMSVTAGATTTTTITFHTLAADCTDTNANLLQTSPVAKVSQPALPRQQNGRLPVAALLIGTGLLGLAARKRPLGALIAIAFTASVLSLNGCGSGSTPLSSSTTSGASSGSSAASTAKGTYNIVLTFFTYPNTSVSTTARATITVQ